MTDCNRNWVFWCRIRECVTWVRIQGFSTLEGKCPAAPSVGLAATIVVKRENGAWGSKDRQPYKGGSAQTLSDNVISAHRMFFVTIYYHHFFGVKVALCPPGLTEGDK